MPEITFIHRAPPGARYGPKFAESCRGKSAPLKFDEQSVGDGTITDAVVVEDGAAVELTLEVPDDLYRLVQPDMTHFSVNSAIHNPPDAPT